MVEIQQNIDVRIGSVMRAAREQSNYSVDALANQVDIPRDTLMAIESGAERAGPAELFRLSKALCIELRSFFGECCNMKHSNPSDMVETLKTHHSIAALVERMQANAIETRVA